MGTQVRSLFKNQNPIEVIEFQKLPNSKIENGGTTQFDRRSGTTVSEFCLGVTNSRKLTDPTNSMECGPRGAVVVNLPRIRTSYAIRACPRAGRIYILICAPAWGMHGAPSVHAAQVRSVLYGHDTGACGLPGPGLRSRLGLGKYYCGRWSRR